MIFHQFFEQESSTYTYLLACEDTQQAILIDPVASEIGHYAKLLAAKNLTLAYSLDTHVALLQIEIWVDDVPFKKYLETENPVD